MNKPLEKANTNPPRVPKPNTYRETVTQTQHNTLSVFYFSILNSHHQIIK